MTIITENEFRLTNIRKEINHVLLTIELSADNETREVYFNNYYEGLYTGTTSAKYSVYAEIKEGHIEGELLFDTIKEYVSNQAGNARRLWVRYRVGNTYIDQAVAICIEEINITFSHMEDYLFSKKNDLEYSINYYNNAMIMKNPLRDPRDPRDIKEVRLSVSKNEVVISATVKEGLAEELCLAWKSLKNNIVYYFHAVSVIDNCLEYILSKDEMNKLDKIKSSDLSFEWIMVDADDNQYELYLDDKIDPMVSVLPVDDYCAQLYRNREAALCMYMKKASVFFNYVGLAYNGNGIRLEFSKRSYDLELLTVVVQRVNTNIEYQLPFEVVSEDERKITYDVRLELGSDENEDNFRVGIYQFFVEMRDGFISARYPLRLFRFKPIKENTYIISVHPYSIIGGHYYNCLFYNDSSDNLKCNFVPKRMKLQLSKAVFAKKEISIPYKIKKEPYFDDVTRIQLVAENGDIKFIDFDDRTKVSDQAEISGCMSIPLQWVYKLGTNCILRLEISFNGRDQSVLVENNFFRPAVINRELCSFSFLNKLNDSVYRRIWGNHVNDSYMIGVTEDAGLFTLVGMWLYEDDKLCIRIEWSDEEDKENYSDKDIALYLRDVITGERIRFEREWAVEDEVIFRISLSEVNNREFLVVGILPNGVVSYIENTTAIYTLLSNTTSKKINLKKVYGTLHISIEEMLLFENAEKVAECRQIITRTKEENAGRDRKIWLIGENNGLSARDNGLAFFEYCMRHKDTIEAEVFFVTKEENEDMEVLKQYKENIVIYDSEEHIYLDELAEFYLVTHGIRNTMPSLYHNKLSVFRKNVIYLRHGIVAMKKTGINNTSYGGSILKILASSQREKKFLVENKQFWEDQIVVTGLARFDKLYNNIDQSNKYIWIMPTWRDWLVTSERDFINSDFYAYYSEILSDSKLLETLKNSGHKLLFTLHVEFEKYKVYFDKFENEVVHISDMHEKSIAKRISECSMIATDYSSIVFDVVYLGKPVLFFQYDQDMYNKYRGSYVDLETDLPGEVTHSPDTFVEALIKAVRNGFVVEDKYCERAKNYFDYVDQKNCERIYNAILDCREEIADEH